MSNEVWTIINAIVSGIITLAGVIMKMWFNRINTELDSIKKDVTNIRIDYVQKPELKDMRQEIMSTLNTLNDKLDSVLLRK